MVASTAHVKTFINQRGNIPIFRTNTNKQNIRRVKNKETKNKNRTKAIELPRLKSSLNFSLWAINGPGVFFFFFFFVANGISTANRVDGLQSLDLWP